MLNAIQNRRSIRKYQSKPVPRELVEQVLQAGILAPSSKNRQPWRFIVCTGPAKARLLLAMEQGLQREAQQPMLPESAPYLASAHNTLHIMQQAPVLIFIMNALGQSLQASLTTDERVAEICNAQSIGAAMQNMTLAATELGLGSLWICDTYFAYPELCAALNAEGELCAALALGYAAENPPARPRLAMEQLTEWLNE